MSTTAPACSTANPAVPSHRTRTAPAGASERGEKVSAIIGARSRGREAG